MDGIQLSMFDMIQGTKAGEPVWIQQANSAEWFRERFQEQVNRGSGFEDGKIRIYAAAEIMDRDKLADFIQQEHGIGGNSIRDGFADYNNRGMIIRKWKSEEVKIYTWGKVRDEVLRQIRNGEFLTKEEMERIREIREQNNGMLPSPHPRLVYGT